MFGEFCCECGNSWTSAYAWEEMGQYCETMILPHTLSPLLPSADGRGQGPPHMRDIIARCAGCWATTAVIWEDEKEQTVCSSSRSAIGSSVSSSVVIFSVGIGLGLYMLLL